MDVQLKNRLRIQAEQLVNKILSWLKNTWSGRIAFLFLLSRIVYEAWPRKSLKGKTILVTGGGGGLGKEIAVQAAKAGANLVLWDLNEAAMATAAAEIETLGYGTKVYTFKVDISKREVVYEMAQKTKERAGFIFCVINNAGIVSGKYIIDSEDAYIQKVFEVNAIANFWTTKAFLPDMIAQNEGHICTIASAAGILGAPKMCDYSASKFAAVGFIESLRHELRKMGKSHIRTTVICPAHIKTELFKGYNPGSFQVSLDPSYVALKVIESIQKNKEVVYMPRMVYVAAFLKAVLPTFLHDLSMLSASTGNAMDSFQGKPLHLVLGEHPK